MPLSSPRRIAAVVLALAAVLVAGLTLTTGGGRAATTSCPSFTVEHNDRIGPLSLPQGAYTVTPSGLSCQAASQLFTQFLNDWDGRLPGGWTTRAQATGSGGFSNGRGQSFTVSHQGPAPSNGLVCSQRFVLAQNDRIGALTIAKGTYLIDRLGPLSPTCAQAATLLKSFLLDFDGRLPGGWLVLPGDGTFVRGSVSYGFRLEPYPSGGGGAHYPTQTTRCGSTFRVQHADRIGALRFPAGPYWLSIYKASNITCAQATQLFAAFLNRPDGSLPSPWVINTPTGSFRRGAQSPYGFVAKPAFNVAATG